MSDKSSESHSEHEEQSDQEENADGSDQEENASEQSDQEKKVGEQEDQSDQEEKVAQITGKSTIFVKFSRRVPNSVNIVDEFLKFNSLVTGVRKPRKKSTR